MKRHSRAPIVILALSCVMVGCAAPADQSHMTSLNRVSPAMFGPKPTARPVIRLGAGDALGSRIMTRYIARRRAIDGDGTEYAAVEVADN